MKTPYPHESVSSLVWAWLLLVPGTVWTVFSVYGIVRCIRDIRPLDDATMATWPRLSLIVPARDEEDALEESVASRLGSDYSELEVVLVDDRSTDATGAIVDRLAALDPRIRGVHVRELPDGWLGKVHALHTGIAASTGEWIVLSDADVHFSPTLLRRAVAHAENNGVDYLSVLPHLWSSGFAIDLCMTSLVRGLYLLARPWAIPSPKSRAAAGAGVFALVRRSALERTKGLPWLRMEVADDVVLGQMLKDSGARCLVVNARDDVGLYFYRSVGELARGLEKNGFAVLARFSIARMLVGTSISLVSELAPVGALVFGEGSLRVAGGALTAANIVVQVVLARWAKRPFASALFPQVGALLLVVFGARASILASTRGWIAWRGTRYSVDDLRRGQRLRF